MNKPGKPEIIGADLPPEPPERTIIVNAKGEVFQRVKWCNYLDAVFYGSTVQWTGVGEKKRAKRPTWLDLLDQGPVTILWRPEVAESDDE